MANVQWFQTSRFSVDIERWTLWKKDLFVGFSAIYAFFNDQHKNDTYKYVWHRCAMKHLMWMAFFLSMFEIILIIYFICVHFVLHVCDNFIQYSITVFSILLLCMRKSIWCNIVGHASDGGLILCTHVSFNFPLITLQRVICGAVGFYIYKYM